MNPFKNPVEMMQEREEQRKKEEEMVKFRAAKGLQQAFDIQRASADSVIGSEKNPGKR